MSERRSTRMQERTEHGGGGVARPPAGAPLRVVLAGGGTGGHLYPALAVAEELRAIGGEVLFVGTPRSLGARIVPGRGYRYEGVRARGLTGGMRGLVLAALEGAVGLAQSLVLLSRERPELVIGTGGYVCAPVVLAATLLRIPSVLLEQNAIPGKATRFLSRFARKVCVSMPESREGLPGSRVEVTGNPIRAEIVARSREEARARLGIPEGRSCVLVTGASQGAASLNRAVLRALPAWLERDWTVLHLTGPGHVEEVEVRSRPLVEGARLDYRPIGYQEDIAEFYAAADLVICRAGATTLAEITARGLPAVLVPYPYAAERHQDHNAAVLARHGAAIVLEDEAVEEGLEAVVQGLLADPEELLRMAGASRTLGRADAAARVVRVALQQAGRRSGWLAASGDRER